MPVQDRLEDGDLESSQVTEVAAALESRREARAVSDLRQRVAQLEAELAISAALCEERSRAIELLERMLALAIPTGQA